MVLLWRVEDSEGCCFALLQNFCHIQVIIGAAYNHCMKAGDRSGDKQTNTIHCPASLHRGLIK